jgi:hypothetical protein
MIGQAEAGNSGKRGSNDHHDENRLQIVDSMVRRTAHDPCQDAGADDAAQVT